MFQLHIWNKSVCSKGGNNSIVYSAKGAVVTNNNAKFDVIPHKLAMKVMIMQRDDLSILRELAILRILTVRYPHNKIISLLYSQRRRYGEVS